jgi:hypothetical protein
VTPGVAAVVALGTAFSCLLALTAVGLSVFTFLRPQRDLEALRSKVRDLANLRVEWENTLSALDVMNKRSARLARRETTPASEPEQSPLSRADVLKMALAKQRKESA